MARGKTNSGRLSRFFSPAVLSLGLASSSVPPVEDPSALPASSENQSLVSRPVKPTENPRVFTSPHMREVLGPILNQLPQSAGNKNVVIISDESLNALFRGTSKSSHLSNVEKRDLFMQLLLGNVITQQQVEQFGFKTLGTQEIQQIALTLLALKTEGVGISAAQVRAESGESTCVIFVPSSSSFYKGITHRSEDEKRLSELVRLDVLEAYILGHEARHCSQPFNADQMAQEIDSDRFGSYFARRHAQATSQELLALQSLRFLHAFQIQMRFPTYSPLDLNADPHQPSFGQNIASRSGLDQTRQMQLKIIQKAELAIRHYFRTHSDPHYEQEDAAIYQRFRDTDNWFESTAKKLGITDWFNGYSFFTPKIENPEVELIRKRPDLLVGAIEGLLERGDYDADRLERNYAIGLVRAYHLYEPRTMNRADVRSLVLGLQNTPQPASAPLIVAQQQP